MAPDFVEDGWLAADPLRMSEMSALLGAHFHSAVSSTASRRSDPGGPGQYAVAVGGLSLAAATCRATAQ